MELIEELRTEKKILWEIRIQGAFALVTCDFIINIIDLYNNYGIILLITLFPLYEKTISILLPNIKGPK